MFDRRLRNNLATGIDMLDSVMRQAEPLVTSHFGNSPFGFGNVRVTLGSSTDNQVSSKRLADDLKEYNDLVSQFKSLNFTDLKVKMDKLDREADLSSIFLETSAPVALTTPNLFNEILEAENLSLQEKDVLLKTLLEKKAYYRYSVYLLLALSNNPLAKTTEIFQKLLIDLYKRYTQAKVSLNQADEERIVECLVTSKFSKPVDIFYALIFADNTSEKRIQFAMLWMNFCQTPESVMNAYYQIKAEIKGQILAPFKSDFKEMAKLQILRLRLWFVPNDDKEIKIFLNDKSYLRTKRALEIYKLIEKNPSEVSYQYNLDVVKFINNLNNKIDILNKNRQGTSKVYFPEKKRLILAHAHGIEEEKQHVPGLGRR
jgi:hypothetical protein